MTADALREPASAEALLEALWSELAEGAARGRHPWHTGVFATAGEAGPTARTVVLRHADRETGTLGLHTDRRAPKCVEIARDRSVAWLFYDAERKVQLRIAATASVLTSGPEFDRAWKRTGLSSRRCYLAPTPPGDDLPDGVNLPDDFRDADPDAERSEAGRENFAVVRTAVTRFDWLVLSHAGHRRAVFEPDGETWTGRFVAA